MTVERLPAVKVGVGVLPPGKHLFLSLDWLDAPDKGSGYYWMIHYEVSEPVEVELYTGGFAVQGLGWQDNDGQDMEGARWLWLGDVADAAKREAKG